MLASQQIPGLWRGEFVAFARAPSFYCDAGAWHFAAG